MSEQNNTAIVQQAFAAFGRGDIAAILPLVDENVDWFGVYGAGPEVPQSGRRHGRKAVGEFFASVGKSLAFSVFEPRDFVAQGDIVVALGHYVCKANPTGRSVESEWAMVFTFRNGKIAKFMEFLDCAALNRAFVAKG